MSARKSIDSRLKLFFTAITTLEVQVIRHRRISAVQPPVGIEVRWVQTILTDDLPIQFCGHRLRRIEARSKGLTKRYVDAPLVPGDAASVRYFVAKRAGGVALYSVAWSPIRPASHAADQ